MDIFAILSLIGGLALFLYGMDEMGDGLKKLSGGKLETILSKLTSTRFKAFLLGLGVTAIIQSSSATTVMLVGFVNAGIMKLGQTLGIIMGANVGTTVTGWLLSLSAISEESTFILKFFKPESFTPILALVGLLLIMAGKSDKKRNLGKIFIGFAILMFGMEAMSDSMGGLKDDPAFTSLLIKFENPFLGIMMGLILTAIIQSSSASVGILQALSITGLVPVPVALPIILGQNIGTTVTPIISSIGGNTDARRVAMACLYIKMIGVVIVCSVFYALNAALGFAFMEKTYMANPVNIAVIHTAFNIISTVILLPFTSLIEKLTIATVKEKTRKNGKSTETFKTLDPRFLTSPAFAVETSRQLVSEMAVITKNSLIESMNLLGNYDADKADELLKTEDEIDIYEDKISSYLLQVSEYKLSQKDSHEVSQLLHVVGDIERISDHSVNIIAAAKEIHTKEIEFSNEAQREISVIANAVREILSLSIEALVNQDLNIAKKVEPLEQIIDKLNHKIKRNHVERLRLGECTIELGFILSDILNNYERVADHCSNIAVCLLEIDNNSFQTHEYLSNVKETGANEFFENYDMYKQRYSL
ncbi:MAG: Na/Pi cotransporter family protein [Clostridia bacterium]|nr:Na/Pi cotransporter family protein [Clostridia bacterium]